MKRYKSKHEIKRKSNSKKEKFWSGSGKFFLVLILLYLMIIGINQIVSLGNNHMEKFTAEKIEVSGHSILSQQKVINLCEDEIKKKNIKVENVAKSILESYFIKGVSVTKRLPRTLNITIEERQPVAFIYGRGLNLIDYEGYLIPLPKIKRSWDLPFISGISESLGKLGQKTKSAQAKEALDLIAHLQENNELILGMISEVNMKDSRFFELIMMKGGAKIRINRSDYDKELYVLENYMQKYMKWSDLAIIDYIDLRFKDQLVVKKKS